MKHLKSTILTLAFSIITMGAVAQNSAPTKATAWNIDPAHSTVNFEVTHFFTPVTGKFQKFNAQINFSPDNLAGSSIRVEIPVNSIDTNNDKRDGHLKTDDFFNAKKYPNITFVSDKITHKSGKQYTAHGKLTIKDVSREIDLPFTLLGIMEHPKKEGVQIAGIKAGTTIDRTDYKVGTGDFAATTVVGDQVDISIALELNSK